MFVVFALRPRRSRRAGIAVHTAGAYTETTSEQMLVARRLSRSVGRRALCQSSARCASSLVIGEQSGGELSAGALHAIG
eukprot:COSAG04_NODE_7151_length_1179_cov_17.262037_3_plen_78_part_01